MDGVHDLGGLDGFGPVEHEAAEPVFAEDWERRVFRFMIGSLGSLRDQRRHVPPHDRTHGPGALPLVAVL